MSKYLKFLDEADQEEEEEPEVEPEKPSKVELESVKKDLKRKTIKKSKPVKKPRGKPAGITGERIREILSTKKPENTGYSNYDRKMVTDYYLKRLILKSFEEYFQESDKAIRIVFE